jgi:hypothetical protein
MSDDNYARAQRAYDRELPEELPEVEADRLTPTLAMEIADWIEQGERKRLLAVADFLINEFNLGDNDRSLDTLAHWIEEPSDPLDFDFERFDTQR